MHQAASRFSQVLNWKVIVLTALVCVLVHHVMFMLWTNAAQRHYRQGARLGQVMAALTPVRQMQAEYFLHHGNFPGSILDLPRLDVDALAASANIDEIWISAGGAIHVRLNERSPTSDRSDIRLTPVETPGLGIKWECESETIEKIDQWLPSCRPPMPTS